MSSAHINTAVFPRGAPARPVRVASSEGSGWPGVEPEGPATGEHVAIGVAAVRPGTADVIIPEGGLNEIEIDMLATRLRDCICDAPDWE